MILSFERFFLYICFLVLQEELLKILGEKHRLYDFLSTLSMKCSYILFNKEHVKEIFLEASLQKSSGNAQCTQSCMDILGVKYVLLHVFYVHDNHIHVYIFYCQFVLWHVLGLQFVLRISIWNLFLVSFFDQCINLYDLPYCILFLADNFTVSWGFKAITSRVKNFVL